MPMIGRNGQGLRAAAGPDGLTPSARGSRPRWRPRRPGRQSGASARLGPSRALRGPLPRARRAWMPPVPGSTSIAPESGYRFSARAMRNKARGREDVQELQSKENRLW